MALHTRTLRILLRPDGRFVIESAILDHGPLGIAGTLNQTIRIAVREATALCRKHRCRVVIAVQKQSGHFQQEQIVNPPVLIRRNPRLAKVSN